MDMLREPRTVVAFGRFAVLPHRRELLIDGRPVKLGGRAFDILMALIESRGSVLSKDALMRRVWHDTVVEENSLARQVATLRKALADESDVIRTVSGRGYLFAAAVQERSEEPASETTAAAAIGLATGSDGARTGLPQPASPMIGREAEQSDVVELLTRSRLVTLTGPGGTGKTRLSLAVAHQAHEDFEDGAWFVELASLHDPDTVAATVAITIGLKISAGLLTAERVARALAPKRLLVVLDNCEHLAGAAAEMAEALLRCAPAVRVMATSREPLKADGECIYRLRPLTVPGESVTDVTELLGHASVQLFLARARALDPDFAPEAGVIATMAAICRRLDGIPLAIELAAVRAAGLGIEELAARIEDRFRLLVDGRRKALPRHRTLQATLDWSYDLLSDLERAVLRRLAVFAGGFTLKSAGAAVADGEITEPDVVSAVVDLVAKSLVVMESDRTQKAGGVRYRLLETTRAYAHGKLGAAGEFDRVMRRHAEHYRDFCLAEVGPSTTWLFKPLGRTCRQEIDNIRAALDWAFSPRGDTAIALALTIASAPAWFQMSLLDPCRRYVEKALAIPAARTDPQLELRLLSALALTQMSREGGPTFEATRTLAQVLDLAESLDDAASRVQAISGLWAYHAMRGDCRAALPLAERLQRIAEHDAGGIATFVGDLLAGVTLHYQGRQAAARSLLEPRAESGGPTAANLARVLWLQGFAEPAVDVITRTLERSATAERVDWLCAALGEAACPIALLAGDLVRLEHHVRHFINLAERHYFDGWRLLARAFDAILDIRRGDLASGIEALRLYRDELRPLMFGRGIFAIELAQGLGALDRVHEAFDVIDGAIDVAEHDDERWCMPELLHVRGQLLLRDGPPRDLHQAESHFLRSLDIAREQGAVFWEQRTAASLARLTQDESHLVPADNLLRPPCDQEAERPASC
jgi:predicted ATPase/DNA-binding winged helix-turn-helix (wHTH) protein